MGFEPKPWNNEAVECGPYTTKAETEEDIRGLLRSRREHPELNDPWYGYDYRRENLVPAGPYGRLVPQVRTFSKISEVEKECYDSKGRVIPFVQKRKAIIVSEPSPNEERIQKVARNIVEPFEYMIQKILPHDYNGVLRKGPKEKPADFEARVRKNFPDWDKAPLKELKLKKKLVLPPLKPKKKLVLPPLAKPGSMAEALFNSFD